MTLELIPRMTNVVITAEHHRPTILSPVFLAACGIVPETWYDTESSTTETLSTVEYHNQVLWAIDSDSLIIEDYRSFDFQDEIEVHNLASNYLREVSAIPYRALGLNFYLALPVQDPHEWIDNQFMPPNFHDAHNHGVRILPRFTLPAGNSTAEIVFGGPETDFDDPPRDDAVLISVHVTRQGLSDSDDALSALSDWPERRATVIRAVSLLIGEQ